MRWYSLGGLLTNLKQKIIGNMLLINKTSGEDSVSPKSPMISSGDVTATKVASLQNVAGNQNCTPPSIKEESSISEMGSQDASQSVAGSEISGKRESTSVKKERLDNTNSLDDSEFAQEKVLRLIQAERVDAPKEPSSKDASVCLLTAEALERLASPGKNQGTLQLSNLFINSDPDKEVKVPMRFEALSNSNSSMSTGESCSDVGDQRNLFGKMLSDPVQKIKNISKENDKHRFSDALQKPESWASFPLRGVSHDQKSGNLATIEEKNPLGSSRKTVVPVAVSRDLSMMKVMDSLNLQTDNGTDADANLWNPNGGERKCVSNGSSVTKKSDRFFATEEEESKGETLVIENQSLCSQVTLAATTANPKLTKKSLDSLSIEKHSPNKVLLRFLNETFKENHIFEQFSEFGAVLDVQELPSFEGCIYKDALLTFEVSFLNFEFSYLEKRVTLSSCLSGLLKERFSAHPSLCFHICRLTRQSRRLSRKLL